MHFLEAKSSVPPVLPTRPSGIWLMNRIEYFHVLYMLFKFSPLREKLSQWSWVGSWPQAAELVSQLHHGKLTFPAFFQVSMELV